MRGKEMTTAARTVAGQEKTRRMLRNSSRKLPMGPRAPKRERRENPATVGGSTRGRVNRPSRMAFQDFRRIEKTHLAARMPRKKVKTVATDAVFREIKMGLRSMGAP